MDDLLKQERLYDYIGNSVVFKAEYGVSADVWIIPDRVVIKAFPAEYPKERLDCEISILEKLSCMRVSECIDRFTYNEREVAVYRYIDGRVSVNPNIEQIKSIAKFLREMHDRLSSINICGLKRVYDVDMFKKDVSESYSPFKKDLESVKFVASDDTIIHGDLFPDNALFIGDELSAVIDFSDASIGDRYLDMAVTIFSWCQDDIEKINAFLDAYGGYTDRERLNEALNFALLFYIFQRYTAGRDWESLYKLRDRFKSLNY